MACRAGQVLHRFCRERGKEPGAEATVQTCSTRRGGARRGQGRVIFPLKVERCQDCPLGKPGDRIRAVWLDGADERGRSSAGEVGPRGNQWICRGLPRSSRRPRTGTREAHPGTAARRPGDGLPEGVKPAAAQLGDLSPRSPADLHLANQRLADGRVAVVSRGARPLEILAGAGSGRRASGRSALAGDEREPRAQAGITGRERDRGARRGRE